MRPDLINTLAEVLGKISMTFKDLMIQEPILEALTRKGYSVPTPIQQGAIPAILQGNDILGCANTGTGKTAAFAVPIIQLIEDAARQERIAQMSAAESSKQEQTNKLSERNSMCASEGSGQESSGRMSERNPKWASKKKRYCKKIQALVLTPTRELALQIDENFVDYAINTNVTSCVIFGGVNQRPQVDKLRKGVDVLTATPGRLLDLMGQGFVNLNNVKYLVLDEADRMLDMGFIHDVKKIINAVPVNRQTLFFSATLPKTIDTFAKSVLNSPVSVSVEENEEDKVNIEQYLYLVEKKEKSKLLVNILKKQPEESVLVFSRTKHGADRIAKDLCKNGIGSEAIHGNKSQNARQKALEHFKKHTTKVLVATDVAARGLDINKLPLVINFDLPDVAETYVHRIGRTGRAGNVGMALSFCEPQERSMVRDIQKLTGRKIQTAKIS